MKISRIGCTLHTEILGHVVELRVETPAFRYVVRRLEAMLDDPGPIDWPIFHRLLDAARRHWPNDTEWVRLGTRGEFHERPLEDDAPGTAHKWGPRGVCVWCGAMPGSMTPCRKIDEDSP